MTENNSIERESYADKLKHQGAYVFKHDVHFDGQRTAIQKIDRELRAYAISLFPLSDLNNRDGGTPFNCDFLQVIGSRLSGARNPGLWAGAR